MRNNTRRHRAIVAALIAISAASAASAQTGGGSTYSIFNIGDLQSGTSAASVGRGSVEAAVPSTSILNSINPAGWSDLQNVTLQAALNFEQYQVSDARGKIYQNNSKLQDFAIAFPFSHDYGGTLAFSLRPYSTVNYRTQVEQEVPVNDSTTTALTTHSGTGGLSEALIGSSFKPVEWLGIGATANLFFGSINARSDVSFPDAPLNEATYQTSDLFVGMGGRFGLVIQPNDMFRLGAVYETGSTLTRERNDVNRFVENGREVIDTISVAEGDFKLPPRITVGASYVTGRFLFAADASFQSWGDEQFVTARPENRFAIGIDRLPSTSMNATGFERWTFRFGGYYRQTYYEMLNGQGIDQMGITLGARYPIGGVAGFNSNTAFDLGIELGRRGRLENGLTQELFGRISFGLAISEIWFLRSRR
jgi:hypothetical protein